MSAFPIIDPIPLPAPVWFFKTLHLLVLSLHFVALHTLLGGLLIGAWWNLSGRWRRDEARLSASKEIAGYLPLIVTYVINFGVPPLLFTQILYGVALYTSSVLIGAWWISVIFLLMALYYLLYVSSKRASAGRAWWLFGFVALLFGMTIAKIYNMNMTLMLRPEAWLDLWRSDPHGLHVPRGDPTMLPRWVFMMMESLTIAGIGLVVAGRRKIHGDAVRRLMTKRGGLLAAVGATAQVLAGFWVFRVQPAAVHARLVESAVYKPVGFAWLALAVLVFVFGIRAARGAGDVSRGFVAALVHLGVLLVAGTVVYRDGIRDLTFAIKGYDVWARHVVANLQVIGIFLAVFVAGVALMAWMIWVVAKAKPADAGAIDAHA
jgi:hypothetical protein